MSVFSSIFGGLWKLIKGLFESTKDAFEQLPPDQQKAILDGTNLSQLLKDNFNRAEVYVIDLVAVKLDVSFDVAKAAILYVGKQMRVTEASVQAVLDHVAETETSEIDDIAHNSFFKQIAEFASFFLGAGALNWVTISLGVIEYAYQWLKSKGELAKGLGNNVKAAADDPIQPTHGPRP